MKIYGIDSLKWQRKQFNLLIYEINNQIKNMIYIRPYNRRTRVKLTKKHQIRDNILTSKINRGHVILYQEIKFN